MYSTSSDLGSSVASCCRSLQMQKTHSLSLSLSLQHSRFSRNDGSIQDDCFIYHLDHFPLDHSCWKSIIYVHFLNTFSIQTSLHLFCLIPWWVGERCERYIDIYDSPSRIVGFWQILHCLDKLRKADERGSVFSDGKQLDALRRALNELIEDLGGMGLGQDHFLVPPCNFQPDWNL